MEPQDFTGMRPGDVIETSEVEAITGAKRTHRDYSFAIMQLAAVVEKQLWDAGKRLSVRTSKDTVVVMTQEQAADYLARKFDNGKKKMRRAHRNAQAIDTTEFTPEQQREHANRLAKQAVTLQSMRRKAETIQPVAYVSNTPSRFTRRES